MEAILVSIDRAHWYGRRDYALLLTMYNLGARVSEISGLRQSQLNLLAFGLQNVLSRDLRPSLAECESPAATSEKHCMVSCSSSGSPKPNCSLLPPAIHRWEPRSDQRRRGESNL
jgi:hypothetical protein